MLTFASAAAVTLGIVSLPVYEIYKAAMDPWWKQGLDAFDVTGLHATSSRISTTVWAGPMTAVLLPR